MNSFSGEMSMLGMVARCGLLVAVLASGPILGQAELGGVVEDLWGQKIDLEACRKGTTLIHPFSPSL